MSQKGTQKRSSTWSFFTGQSSSSSPPTKRKREQQTNSNKEAEIFHDCIEIMSSDDENIGGSSNAHQMPPSSRLEAKNPSSTSAKRRPSAPGTQNNSLTGQQENKTHSTNTSTQTANSYQRSQDATTSVPNQKSNKEPVVSASQNVAMTCPSDEDTAIFHEKEDTTSSKVDQKASLGSTTSKQSMKSLLATATTPRNNRDDTNQDFSKMRATANNKGQTSKSASEDVIDLLSSDEEGDCHGRNTPEEQKIAAKSRTPGGGAPSSSKSPKNQEANSGMKEKKRVIPLCIMPRKKVPPVVPSQTTSTNQVTVSRRSDVGLSTSRTPIVIKGGRDGADSHGNQMTKKRNLNTLGSALPLSGGNDEKSPNGTPGLEELKSKCWKCLVQLRMDEASDEMCCYAMHTHPLFEVPICCICSSEVAAVEADHESDQEEDSQFCSGCGNHEDDLDFLLICDKCHRGMCKKCVSQSYGVSNPITSSRFYPRLRSSALN